MLFCSVSLRSHLGYFGHRIRMGCPALPALLLLVLSALAPVPVRAQEVRLYESFSAATLPTARWQVINQAGSALAGVSTSGGILTVTGRSNRTGAASNARLTEHGAVEVDALGWDGTNQILQLYSGTGGFNHFIEFGLEGTDPDGTPILNVWLPTGRTYRDRSPVPGPISPQNRTTLRIERNGQDYKFFANGNLVHQVTTDALDNDARVFLYGWATSVSRWDNVRLSGPDALIVAPAPGTMVEGPVTVTGIVGSTATGWTLEVGAGGSPSAWTPLASGTGSASGTLGTWDPGDLPDGSYALRLRATDETGQSRSGWSVVTIARPSFYAPREGQRVGPSFPVLLENIAGATSVRYYDNGALFATAEAPPYLVRRTVPDGADGEHTLTAEITMGDGSVRAAKPVKVMVDTDLYGRNPRPADQGRAFVFPDGSVTVTIGQNDGYPWPDLWQAYRNGDTYTTENYVKMLRANGVNVMRIMLEYAQNPNDFMENPLGTYNPKVVAFWDWFFPMCEKYGMTVLATPWDTFWMNQPWSNSPYNAANGGPCATQADFIRSPEARAWQKARFKFIIDRWGNSPAIFAIDLLNEFDIWWNPATEAERADWVNEMATYVREYELQKWGHAHMLTVSSAAANPGGIIGEVVYRHPLFEFANTHQYYGPVNDPKNIIDPALAVNGGTKYSLSQIVDGRPYVDSESGPISLSSPWLTNDTPFDDQYYHHMAWAHFATGGSGPGMRWPYRQPHYLSPGMHQTQRAISLVASRLDWTTFSPRNADDRVSTNMGNLIDMASADTRQALIWVTQDVRNQAQQSINGAEATLTGMAPGRYEVMCRNAYTGAVLRRTVAITSDGRLVIALPALTLDMAVTVRAIAAGDVNADLLVNVADAQAALRIAAGLQAAGAGEAIGADLDADGLAGLTDATALLRRVLEGEGGQ